MSIDGKIKAIRQDFDRRKTAAKKARKEAGGENSQFHPKAAIREVLAFIKPKDSQRESLEKQFTATPALDSESRMELNSMAYRWDATEYASLKEIGDEIKTLNDLDLFERALAVSHTPNCLDDLPETNIDNKEFRCVADFRRLTLVEQREIPDYLFKSLGLPRKMQIAHFKDESGKSIFLRTYKDSFENGEYLDIGKYFKSRLEYAKKSVESNNERGGENIIILPPLD